MWAVPNVAFSDLRKLKRWRPRELEEDLHITTLVDVHDTRLALADFDRGHGMNDLRYVLLRLAFPASIVTQCRDGEFSRLLCYPADFRCEYASEMTQLFRDRIGVVVEGTLTPAGVFESRRLMVSHDNQYRAPADKNVDIKTLMRTTEGLEPPPRVASWWSGPMRGISPATSDISPSR